MKTFLIVLGVIIIVIIGAIIMFFALFPEGVAEFMVGMTASEFEVEVDGKESTIKFSELGEGVSPDDRVYALKKLIAFEILVEGENAYFEEQKEFEDLLVRASQDRTLDADEFEELKNIHSDILPDDHVIHFIELAKKYEKEEKEHKE